MFRVCAHACVYGGAWCVPHVQARTLKDPREGKWGEISVSTSPLFVPAHSCVRTVACNMSCGIKWMPFEILH